MRETKIIIAPVSKKEIVVKSFITGREKRELNALYLREAENFTEEQKVNGVRAAILQAVQDLQFKTLIVSVDGKSEDIVNSILDLQSKDFLFVVDVMNKIINDESFEEKKTI